MKKKNPILIFLISLLGYALSNFIYSIMIIVGDYIGDRLWIFRRIIEILAFISVVMVAFISDKLNKRELDKYRCYFTAGIIYIVINVLNLVSIAYGTKFNITYVVFLVVGIVYTIKGYYGKKEYKHEN